MDVGSFWAAFLYRRSVLGPAGAAVLLLLHCTGAGAQTPQDIERAGKLLDRIEQQQRQLTDEEQKLQQRLRKQHRIEVEPPQQLPSVPGETCWEIDKIELKGATLLAPEELRNITGAYEGRCIQLQDINDLLQAITLLYFNKGYVTTRAYIAPGQDLKKRQLEIMVMEGKLEGILVKDGKGGKTVNLDYVFPGMQGKAFNLRDMEQGLDQINRLPSNNARLSILPGKEPGGSILLIKNQAREPFTYLFTADNQGSSSTGKQQLGATVLVDNPLGMMDQFSINYRRTRPVDPDKYTASLVTAYTIPHGYDTWGLSGVFSQYATPLALSSGGSARLSGRSLSLTGRLSRVVYRDQVSRLSLTGALTWKRNRNYLANEVIESSSQDQSIAEVGMDYSRGLLGGALSLGLRYYRGLDLLNGHKQAPNRPVIEFNRYNLTAGFQRPFSLGKVGNALFSTRLSGQYSPNLLYGTEQISIGGYYSVRGYRDVTLAGASGAYLRNELSVVPAGLRNLFGQGSSISLFLGYDLGRIWPQHGLPGGHMTGMAYGIRSNHSLFSLELSGTRPLANSKLPGHPEPTYYMQLTLNGEGKATGDPERSASSDGWFAGVQAGWSRFTIQNVYVANAIYGTGDTLSAQALMFGRNIGLSRIYGTIWHFDDEPTFKRERMSLNFESRLLNAPLAPYAGISIGYASYEETGLDRKNPLFVLTANNVTPKNNIELSGLTYGLKAGLHYEHGNLFADLAYEYTKVEASDQVYFDGVRARFEIGSIQTGTLGIGLRF